MIWAPKDRDFICVEPMAGITDAINLAQKGSVQELQTIAPGGLARELLDQAERILNWVIG